MAVLLLLGSLAGTAVGTSREGVPGVVVVVVAGELGLGKPAVVVAAVAVDVAAVATITVASGSGSEQGGVGGKMSKADLVAPPPPLLLPVILLLLLLLLLLQLIIRMGGAPVWSGTSTLGGLEGGECCVRLMVLVLL